MAKKKPVWVDEDAHAILKHYSKLVKSSMVDVASDMVLSRLDELPADAGLSVPASHAAAAAKAVAEPEAASVTPESIKDTPDAGEVIATADSPPKIDEPESGRPERPSPSRGRKEQKEGETRFLGGVWLV